MGKITGFLEYERQLPPERSPQVRLLDWNEFHGDLPEEAQRIQGARCMDCGTPFCHTGLIINGAASGCPIHNLIPEFNELIYQGQWKEAWERLAKTNNFPEFTGRVCPAPCEGSCTESIHDPAVTIKNNEWTITTRAFAEGWVRANPPTQRTGKKVAVIGSGPAGLAAADQLNRAGHWVTVYERADRPGGLLQYGIPNMKLDKGIVSRRIQLLKEAGITFITGVEVGKDLDTQKLKDSFDSIILCAGATQPRDLTVPGRELSGIHFAVDFLRENTKTLQDEGRIPDVSDTGSTRGNWAGAATANSLSAQGKNIIVIGGGDTGTDCVGTSLRHGAESICQLEIMPCPAAERQPGNPWPQWPFILRTDYGQQEAISRFGADPRRYLTTVKSFEGNSAGEVVAVHTVQVRWEEGIDGRKFPVELPETRERLPADMVLLAMGFLGPERTLPEAFSVPTDVRSNVMADASYMTSQPGLFVAGDMRRGQSLVVWAIQEGRKAARACDAYLMGESFLAE